VNEYQNWPADDPWWRFTPKTAATGYLAVVAGIALLVSSGIALFTTDLNLGHTVLEIVLAVLGVLMLVRSVTGLQNFRR
jgi:hypothetical protein